MSIRNAASAIVLPYQCLLRVCLSSRIAILIQLNNSSCQINYARQSMSCKSYLAIAVIFFALSSITHDVSAIFVPDSGKNASIVLQK